MENYKEVYGDLIELAKKGDFDAIAHGCNCQKTMGAGIAKTIKENFRQAWFVDQKDYRFPLSRLGDYSVSFEENNMSVFNLYTQFNPGADLDYNALCLCFKKLNIILDGQKLGLPLIGCGIAGGDWKKVKALIKRYLKNVDVTVVIFKK